MRLVVLISGRGSNLKSIIEKLPEAQILAVISNTADAKGLQYAKLANAKIHIIKHTDYSSRISFDKQLRHTIDKYQPDLILLAGFMRILSDEFVNYFQGRLINIHPSLLPKYKGTNTHKRVLQSGDTIHGATVHFVSTELDSGEIIKQAKVPVQPNDTIKTLADRVLKAEHDLYPKAIQELIATKRLLKITNHS